MFLNEIPRLDSKVTLQELRRLAWDKARIPDDKKPPEASFENITQGVLKLIRATCINLYIDGKNSSGFRLITQGNEVVWKIDQQYFKDVARSIEPMKTS